MKVLVVYYSMYGHVYRLGQEVAEGARAVEGVEADLRRIPETLPREVLEKMGQFSYYSNLILGSTRV